MFFSSLFISPDSLLVLQHLFPTLSLFHSEGPRILSESTELSPPTEPPTTLPTSSLIFASFSMKHISPSQL